MKRYTIAEIKRIAEQNGSYYFSRDTMRFFHNTMRDLKVRHVDGNVYVINTIGGAINRFDPETGDLHLVSDDDRDRIITAEQMQEYLHNRSRRMGF